MNDEMKNGYCPQLWIFFELLDVALANYLTPVVAAPLVLAYKFSTRCSCNLVLLMVCMV